MKVNEVVYYCLDAIKAFSDDSSVNEDHIKFLLGKYRGALLQQYHNLKKIMPESNYQTICINLQIADSLPCTPSPKLVSIEKIPEMLTIGKPKVLLSNGFDSEIIEFVPFARLKNTGYNKWKLNFIYAAIGPDNHLYLSFSNPQAKYLTKLKLKGIFEDFETASDLTCADMEDTAKCDVMERDFPMEVSLIPDLIARVVKDALGIAYRPADQKNDAADSLSDIATFVRQNMKKKYNNAVEGTEDEE